MNNQILSSIEALKNKDENVRVEAIKNLQHIFEKNKTLPENVMPILIMALSEDESESVKSWVIVLLEDLLYVHKAFYQSIIDAFVTTLEDEFYTLRYFSIDALGRQKNLSDSIIRSMAKLLDDEHILVIQKTIEVLSQRRELPDDIRRDLRIKAREKYEDFNC